MPILTCGTRSFNVCIVLNRSSHWYHRACRREDRSCECTAGAEHADYHPGSFAAANRHTVWRTASRTRHIVESAQGFRIVRSLGCAGRWFCGNLLGANGPTRDAPFLKPALLTRVAGEHIHPSCPRDFPRRCDARSEPSVFGRRVFSSVVRCTRTEVLSGRHSHRISDFLCGSVSQILDPEIGNPNRRRCDYVFREMA